MLRLVDSDGAYALKMAPVSLSMYFRGISSMLDNAGFNCSKLVESAGIINGAILSSKTMGFNENIFVSGNRQS